MAANGIVLTSDFEGGNGKNFRRLSDVCYQLETEGDYRADDELYTDRKMATDTHGLSLHGRFSRDPIHSLMHQLAKHFNTLAYQYEPNMRLGTEGVKKRGVEILKVLLDGVEVAGR